MSTRQSRDFAIRHHVGTPTLGTTQPFILRLPEVLSSGAKRLEREDDRSPRSRMSTAIHPSLAGLRKNRSNFLPAILLFLQDE